MGITKGTIPFSCNHDYRDVLKDRSSHPAERIADESGLTGRIPQLAPSRRSDRVLRNVQRAPILFVLSVETTISADIDYSEYANYNYWQRLMTKNLLSPIDRPNEHDGNYSRQRLVRCAERSKGYF